MTTNGEYVELFESGSLFRQTQLLDNFYVQISIDGIPDAELLNLLTTAINRSVYVFIKRTAFKLLAELTLLGRINNFYRVLGIAQEFLTAEDSILRTVALKYIPYFTHLLTSAILSTITHLTDDRDGEVAGQAYFCLGLCELQQATSGKDPMQAMVKMNEAVRYFLAAAASSEQRSDADFMTQMIYWLLAVNRGDAAEVATYFGQIEQSLR
ncbi:MAG: hypothetical protein ACTHNW_09090, partial [Mucilaginibacter sp.]